MRIEDEEFKKPAPDEETIIRWYNNKKNASVRSRTKRNKSKIHYQREKGGLIKNKLTGETKPYKQKEFKNRRKVWRKHKDNRELILNNFKGGQNEKLIEIIPTVPVPTQEEVQKIAKNDRERIQRKCPNTEYIRVILYISPYEPVIHIWLKASTESELVIEQDTLDSICNSNEAMIVIDITSENVAKLASYQSNRRFSQDFYPSNMEIYSYSKGIKLIEEEHINYSTAEIKLTGYSPTFQKVKSYIVGDERNKEIIQVYTYQEFVKNEEEIIREKKEMQEKEEMEKKIRTNKRNGRNIIDWSREKRDI